jgi:cycloeucalenol cycloisomerase
MLTQSDDIRAKALLDAEKKWTEQLILKQSPIWIIGVALVMLTGILRQWSDIDYLLFSTAMAAPSVLLPAFSPTRPAGTRPWFRCFWFKLNIWVLIVVCFGTYFGTHYFFDLMGMRYAFDVKLTFDSDILGHSGQRVPLFMYPLTHAYFMTYFATMLIAEREIMHRFKPSQFGSILVVTFLAYSVAFAETYFMASPLLSGLFAYDNRHRMLTFGSFGYSSYFVVGLPMVRRIDSDGKSWSLDRVVIEALATCMAILVLLEAWAKLIGPL